MSWLSPQSVALMASSPGGHRQVLSSQRVRFEVSRAQSAAVSHQSPSTAAGESVRVGTVGQQQTTTQDGDG